MSKNNLKMAAFILILIITALGCTTITGENTLPTSLPPTALPSNTPVPPPTEAPPTEAPPTEAPPTEAPPTEAPAQTTGEILFMDDFSDPTSGWDDFSNEEGSTQYNNGVYQISIQREAWFFWANPYLDFGDVIVEVEAQKISGEDDMSYGIICRHLDVDNWYVLNVSADGYAAIRKRYQGSDLTTLTDWVPVSSINTGSGTNLLRAECVGDRLSLYVNGTLAIETFDSDIPTGDVGLMAGTFEQPLTEVIYDNFIVSSPN